MRARRAIVLLVLLSALLAMLGWVRGAVPREADGVAHGATTFVFGQLRRAGDASSFAPDARWTRVTQGSGEAHHVMLVVVPRETAPDSLPDARAIESAQGQGELFVIDSLRRVPAADVHAFVTTCLAGARGDC